MDVHSSTQLLLLRRRCCPGLQYVRDNSYLKLTPSLVREALDYDFLLHSFFRIFAYIQGKNDRGAKIDMTAPVLVDVNPSAGPFCNSSFTVHFYLPGQYQQGPPPLSGQARPTRLPPLRYAAVRRFGGFMDDSNIAPQVSASRSSLEGTPWEASLEKKPGGSDGYSVAGYNSPFEYKDRVNEVLLWFD